MWAYDALVGLSLFHLGFPPCPEGVDGIGRFEDLRARIGENIHACRHGEAAGAVRHRQRLDPAADAHLERHREGLAVRCPRSEEHTSELQSLMRISSAAFCLKSRTQQPPLCPSTYHTPSSNSTPLIRK